MRATTCMIAALGLLAGTAAATRIENLPGYDNSSRPLSMFSGYETVDASHNRRLFYWLVQALEKPSEAPLLMWLNGGPGCSSLGGGLMSELGPFFPQPDGTLKPNDQTWANVANVLFVESPAGVGFSFSDDPADYTVGDERSAMDLWRLLQGFLAEFPEYKDRDFYISGESYGGHYVPTTAATILNQNELVKSGKVQGEVINIKGFAVGNAWTDAPVDNAGSVLDWWSHATISDETAEGLLRTCNFSNIGPLAAQRVGAALGVSADVVRGYANPAECDAYQLKADEEQGAQLDIYDLYVDSCVASSVLEHAPRDSAGRPPARNQAEQLLRYLGRGTKPVVAPHAAASLATGRRLAGTDNAAGCEKEYEPCIDTYTTNYLNRDDVQRAIYANMSLGYNWTECSNIVDYSRQDLLTSVVPVYRTVLKAGLRVMVYSGDVDAIVSVVGTRLWLRELEMTEAKDGHWRPYLVNGQVGGYVTVYEEGLTFATVRNAGHMVPQTQRDRALHMITKFLGNENL